MMKTKSIKSNSLGFILDSSRTSVASRGGCMGKPCGLPAHAPSETCDRYAYDSIAFTV